MNMLLFAATVLIWGSTWLAISLQLGVVPVLVSVFYRFALAAVLLLPVMLLTGRLSPARAKDHGFMLLQGAFLFCLNFLCFYTATGYIASGLVSVVFSLATIYNAINNRLFFGERITRRMVLATVVGCCGLILLFSDEIGLAGWNPGTLKGIGLAALGTLFFSLGNMVSKRNSIAGLSPLTTNAWGMSYGSALLLGLILVTRTPITAPPDGTYLLALIYLAVIGSVIGFTTYLMMVARMGPGKAAYATVMFPVVALTLSTLFEGYQWHLAGMVGLALTLCGNLILFLPLRRG